MVRYKESDTTEQLSLHFRHLTGHWYHCPLSYDRGQIGWSACGSISCILSTGVSNWIFFSSSELVFMCNGRIHHHIHTQAHIGSHHLLSVIYFFYSNFISVSSIVRWFLCFYPSQVLRGLMTESVMIGCRNERIFDMLSGSLILKNLLFPKDYKIDWKYYFKANYYKRDNPALALILLNLFEETHIETLKTLKGL